MKQLFRSSTDKQVAGVCGGIAEYYSTDPTIIRLGWVFVTLVSGIVPGVIAYLIAMVIIPVKSDDK